MTYSKRKFGAELLLCLEEGYNPERIAKWADNFYYEHLKELDDDIGETVKNLASMSFGQQFIYSEKEIKDLAINLINKESILNP